MKCFSSRLAPAIEEYLEFRKAMGRSACHEGHLELFDRFCCEQHPMLEILSKEAVLGWIAHESEKEHNALSYKASAIRQLAKYMGSGAYTLPSDFAPKKKGFTPYIFTDKELVAFFRAADSLPRKGGRDAFLLESAPVLLRLLYTCGLRPGEGRLLLRENICFETGEILITKTKGRKERIVVMSDDVLDMCKRYDTRRAVVAESVGHFFVLSNGQHIPRSQFWSLVCRCWADANPHTPPHMLPQARAYDLRHRFASAVLQKWLDEGRDLYAMLPYLSAYMGHKHLSATAYYIHILPENLLRSPGVDWARLDEMIPEVDVWED